VSIKPAFF